MHELGPSIEEQSCPICLQSYEPIDRAVISSCLHSFCIGCLQAWCRKSETRLCPLCKRRIVGYLYDIKSDHEYKEHALDDEPPQQQQQPERRPVPSVQPTGILSNSQQSGLGRYQPASAHQRQSIQTQQLQYVAHQGETQRPRVHLRSEAGYTWGDPSDWRRSVVPSENRPHSSSRTAAGSISSQQQSQQQQRQVRSRWSDADGSATAAAGGDRGVAPRPYYWRVQQRMLASVTRPHSSSAPSVDTSAALETRRSIYRNKLYALPHTSAVTSASASNSSIRSSSSSMRVSEAALELWMERELQALLLEDDVTIICAYVKGLVNTFGISLPTAQQQQQQQQRQLVNRSNLQPMRQAAAQAAAAMGLGSSSGSSSDALGHHGSSSATISSAVAALEGFLFEAASQFWHELCCYASSGLTIATWDRVARYVPAAQLHQHLTKSQQQQQQQQQRSSGNDGCVEGSPDVVLGLSADSYLQQQDQQQHPQHQQQQQQATACHGALDQQLSLMRDAVAVREYLERQHAQWMLGNRAGALHTADRTVPSAEGPPAAAPGEGADAVQRVVDRNRGSSSSGSSSSRQQQRRHGSRRSRHGRSRSRNRSRSRSSSGCSGKNRARVSRQQDKQNYLHSTRRQHEYSSSRRGKKSSSTSISRPRARTDARQQNRRNRSRAWEGKTELCLGNTHGQGQRVRWVAADEGAGAAAAGCNGSWGGQWNDGEALAERPTADDISGHEAFSHKYQQQQLVQGPHAAADDRWPME